MSTKKILIVEDDPDINKALRIRLQADGYSVICAEDSLLGLSAAVREHPDLMLLDVTMPAGDGFSIVERIRDHTDLPDIPFIVLTASKRPEYAAKARELGAVAYFEKPYESQELLSVVRSALDGTLEPAA